MASKQVPAAGELVLDHVAHFVPHVDSASSALEELGFTLTPFSEQSQRTEPGGPLMPAGAGNRCVLKSKDIAATGDCLRQSEPPVRELGNRRLLVKLPPGLGGIIVFEPKNSGVLNFE